MPVFSFAGALVLSLLFRFGHAGRPWRRSSGARPGRQQEAPHVPGMIRHSGGPVGLAAVSMPVPLAAPVPAVVANAVTQQLPTVANPSGLSGYFGRIASAACVATAGAIGTSRRRRRRGAAGQLSAFQRSHEVLLEAPEAEHTWSSGSNAPGAVLPTEVAELRQAVHNMQLQLYQPQLQFVAVGWAAVFMPVESQDYVRMEQRMEQLTASAGEDVASGFSASAMSITKADAAKVLEQLSGEDSSERRLALDWVIKSAWPLATSCDGSRVVQKAFDVAVVADQALLRETLRGHVMEAVKSPHANHVLQKCIAVTPASQLGFVIEEMQGNAALAAKSRYGCRILERLIEHHCSALPAEVLMDEIVDEASSLCRHSFANFVVQHILEHGSVAQKARIAEVLLPEVCRLAKHRVASHVVQSALVYASSEDKLRLKQAMSCDTAELEDIRKTQCGRFVVDEMGRV